VLVICFKLFFNLPKFCSFRVCTSRVTVCDTTHKLPWPILTKCYVSAHFMFGDSKKRLRRVLKYSAVNYNTRPGIIIRGGVL